MKKTRLTLIVLVVVAAIVGRPLTAEENEFAKTVAPLLRKYCAACHNQTDREGGLAVDNYAQLLKGGKHGSVIQPRRGEQSRLIRVLTGQSKPTMPPDDSDKPTDTEIAILKSWIDRGARGPNGGEPDPTILVTPTIKPKVEPRSPIHAVAVSPNGGTIVLARYGGVELLSISGKLNWRSPIHGGIVNDVAFSNDGRLIIAAGGEAGLFGEVRFWNSDDGELVQTIRGHADSLYAVALSPDNSVLATACYDRSVKLWDAKSGEEIMTVAGHNGAVFDVAFHPNGKLLATASGDRTVKLWDVKSGKRLDTLGQSLKELYTLEFSPDGKRIAAGGVDNRIRVWQISKTGAEGTNTLLFSRFAHDAPILRLVYSADSGTIVTAGEDRLIKVWNAKDVSLRSTFERQSDWPTGLALTPDDANVFAGRLDGSFAQYKLSLGNSQDATSARPASDSVAHAFGEAANNDMKKIPETEPNNLPADANELVVPIVAQGRLFDEQVHGATDNDLFSFVARAGESWVIETNAARSDSPIDTKIEVLNKTGQPVERLLLRAVRDSEVTFRGINSEQLNCRVVNWEEMELNQYLYIGGEVVKLFRAPRGPDSGFNFYPNTGKRYCYFDTSARSHALGAPCYIVEAFQPGSTFPENGLPLFPIVYENDDESQQTLGKDSKLTFVAPRDGKYLVRVSDVRGFSGESFKYELIVRRPRPDFKVTLHGAGSTVNAGSGKEFRVQAERLDGFDGPIRIDVRNLPNGFSATTPLVIQPGHIEAWGAINAHPSSPPISNETDSIAAEKDGANSGKDKTKPKESSWSKTVVTATAMIGDQEINREVNNLGAIKLGGKPKLQAFLELNEAPRRASWPAKPELGFPNLPELIIAPGTSVTCRLRIERNDFKDRVSFDVNNLPHGIIVDDIGLSGVLITEGSTERTIFLKAANWVPETSRLFHAVAKVDGNQVTLPMMLHVRRDDR